MQKITERPSWKNQSEVEQNLGQNSEAHQCERKQPHCRDDVRY
jgi:hypothetical protein